MVLVSVISSISMKHLYHSFPVELDKTESGVPKLLHEGYSYKPEVLPTYTVQYEVDPKIGYEEQVAVVLNEYSQTRRFGLKCKN